MCTVYFARLILIIVAYLESGEDRTLLLPKKLSNRTYHFQALLATITLCSLMISIMFNSYIYAQNWSSYTDPNEIYRLQFPSNWDPSGPNKPEDNRPLALSIQSTDVPSNMRTMIISVVPLTKNVNSTLETIKDISMNVNSQDLPTFHVLSSPNYTKYTIDNNPAVSYTFGYDLSGKMKELYVGTIINNTVFHIGYAAPLDEFDLFLPTVEKVLDSIKPLKTN